MLLDCINFIPLVKYLDFKYYSFIKGQPKYQPPGNIDQPGSPYLLNGYSGWLGARSTSV
jgi:hypothetical protein